MIKTSATDFLSVDPDFACELTIMECIASPTRQSLLLTEVKVLMPTANKPTSAELVLVEIDKLTSTNLFRLAPTTTQFQVRYVQRILGNCG